MSLLNLMRNISGNMKSIRLADAVRFSQSVPGAYVRCDADNASAERMAPANASQRATWYAGQLDALRAPANRSALRGFDFLVLHAIGRNAWNKGVNSPVNLDVYASESAYQAECWRNAMSQMRSFYEQASRRKGIKL